MADWTTVRDWIFTPNGVVGIKLRRFDSVCRHLGNYCLVFVILICYNNIYEQS